jgi:hypothetical protein
VKTLPLYVIDVSYLDNVLKLFFSQTLIYAKTCCSPPLGPMTFGGPAPYAGIIGVADINAQ